MRTRRVAYIAFLLFLGQAHNSAAQSARGLILLNNFQQDVNFSYQFDGQTSNSRTSETYFRDHRITEAYRFNVDYGLYSRRLLKGHLFAELRADQEMFDGTKAGRPG